MPQEGVNIKLDAIVWADYGKLFKNSSNLELILK
jgi:hypothetical protein